MFARWDTNHNRQVELTEALPAAPQQTAATLQRAAAQPVDSVAGTASPDRRQASSR